MRSLISLDANDEASALALAGSACLIASAMAGALAVGHMIKIGAICGQVQPHCIWCGVATVLAAAGLLSLGAAVATARPERKARALARRSN